MVNRKPSGQPITTTIYCPPHLYPDNIQDLAAQAHQRMVEAGAINITNMQYRIRRDTVVDGLVQPFGIEFYAQADKGLHSSADG